MATSSTQVDDELADESLSKVSICLLKMWELYPGQWREPERQIEADGR